jgi:hypothetical protein
VLDAGSRPMILQRLVVPWMSIEHADHLVQLNATELIKRLATYIPLGPVGERLSPHSEGVIEAQEEYTSRYEAEEKERENKRAERLQSLHLSIAQGPFVKALGAFYHLQDETWPELSTERIGWLAEQVSTRFVDIDLKTSIIFGEGKFVVPANRTRDLAQNR